MRQWIFTSGKHVWAPKVQSFLCIHSSGQCTVIFPQATFAQKILSQQDLCLQGKQQVNNHLKHCITMGILAGAATDRKITTGWGNADTIMSATAGCGKSIMSPITGEDKISMQQRLGTKVWLNSLWYSITGACKLHRQRIRKSHIAMTILLLPMPSGCTITAPHIRLRMHSGVGNILLSSGSVVQRPNLGMVPATTHLHSPSPSQLLEFKFIQTSEICQDSSAIA